MNNVHMLLNYIKGWYSYESRRWLDSTMWNILLKRAGMYKHWLVEYELIRA